MPTKYWFKEWFDSEDYHKLYNHRNQEEAETFIQNLNNHVNQPGMRVLDMAYGKGRHAQTFADLGHTTVGFDLSKNSIEHARQRGDDGIEFHVHDMRSPFPFGQFDLIASLFTSLGYFDTMEENILPLEHASASLRTNGLLVVDFINVFPAVAKMRAEEIIEREGVRYHIERSVQGRVLVKRIRFKRNDTWQEHQERVFGLVKEDFMQCFKKNNLVLKDVFGDYSLNYFDKQRSPRLILLAQKK